MRIRDLAAVAALLASPATAAMAQKTGDQSRIIFTVAQPSTICFAGSADSPSPATASAGLFRTPSAMKRRRTGQRACFSRGLASTRALSAGPS